MDDQRKRYFRVGLLLTVFGGVFLALVAFVIGQGLHSDRVEYHILFEENVKGMVVGSKVNYQGVPTGVVTDIRFQGGFTHVTLSLDPTKATVYDVTRARLDRLLVTGQITVELEGWSEEARPLPAGSMIEPKQDPLHSLTTKAIPNAIVQSTSVLERADRVLESIELLLSDRNRHRVGAILENLEQATETLPTEIADVLGELHNTLNDARGALDSIDNTAFAYGELAGRAGEMTATLRAARAALEKLGALEASFTRAASEFEGLVATARGPTLGVLQSFRDSLREVQGMVRLLRLAPNSLVFGREHPSGLPVAPGGGQ